MKLPTVLRLVGLSAVFCISGTLATPPSYYIPLEGSTDEEELNNFTSSLPTSDLLSDYQTTPVGPTHVDADFLSQVMNLLKENMLLVLVAGTFILIVFLIICGAIFMSRRRKVNAYYPSSYPSKMYVDHRDKTGGSKPFNEVPDKAAPEQESEPVDSHKQLQADITRAAKSLRTPNKSVDAAEGRDPSRKVPDHSTEDNSKPDGSVLERELPSLPKEKELTPQLSDSEAAAAAAAGSPELNSPEEPHPEEDEPLIDRRPRPPSLHIHNDSATLELIAGEKTAF